MQSVQLTPIDNSFCSWMDEVEKIVLEKTNFHLLDLDDEMYMVNFEDGTTPQQMANVVIKSFDSWVDSFGL